MKEKLEAESLEIQMQKIPKINVQAFNSAKSDILEYIKERLKNLITYHVLLLFFKNYFFI